MDKLRVETAIYRVSLTVKLSLKGKERTTEAQRSQCALAVPRLKATGAAQSERKKRCLRSLSLSIVALTDY